TRRAGGPVAFGVTAVLLAGLVGCGSPGETFLPVEGRVTFNGKPLTKGTVVLYPDAGKGNASKHEPRGGIEADGRYKIFTPPKAGAPPGWDKGPLLCTEPTAPNNLYLPPPPFIPHPF